MIITDRGSNYYNYPDMNRLSMKHIIIVMVLIFTAAAVCDAQSSGKTRGRNPEKSLFGQHRKVKTKDAKVKEPKAVSKAKKEQEKKKAKVDKDYKNYVEVSKKRAFKIQSPEVQARMKQNQKDIGTREKQHKKKESLFTKNGQKKYKK